VVLYEDELDDNGISLLTAKVVCSRSCHPCVRCRVLELHLVFLYLFDFCFLTGYVGICRRE
jgi:hypothetical protein